MNKTEKFFLGILALFILTAPLNLILMLCFSTPTPKEVFPSPQLLLALRTVESSLRADAVSEAGARGLYQIMPLTWQDHSTEPFSRAFDPSENEKTAIVYLKWLRHTLSLWEEQEEEKLPLDHLLSCWHGGIGRFRQRGYDPRKMPGSTKHFVGRVIGEIRP